jgi:hypothetical protein
MEASGGNVSAAARRTAVVDLGKCVGHAEEIIVSARWRVRATLPRSNLHVAVKDGLVQRGAGVEHVPVERSLPSRGFSNRRAMGRKRAARRRVTDAQLRQIMGISLPWGSI